MTLNILDSPKRKSTLCLYEETPVSERPQNFIKYYEDSIIYISKFVDLCIDRTNSNINVHCI